MAEVLEAVAEQGWRLNSIAGAQRHLGGVSRATVERLIRKGRLKPVRIGRRCFISDEASGP